jgi:tetratricopeptide (TPR) repeat protein
MDLGEPAERAALNAEHIALAMELGRPLQELRGRMRLIVDELERGDIVAAREQYALARSLADRVAVARHTWWVEALGAVLAAIEGRFDDAWAHHDRAWRTASATEDAAAARALSLQRVGLVRTHDAGGDALSDALEAMFSTFAAVGGVSELYARSAVAGELARDGRVDDARVRATGDFFEYARTIGDTSLVVAMLEVALATNDAVWIEHGVQAAVKLRERNESWGLSGLAVHEPMTRILGVAEARRGRFDAAWAYFQHARERAATMGAHPHTARILYEEGVARTAAGHDERARQCLARAAERAAALGMHGLVRRVERAQSGPTASAPKAPAPVAVPRAAFGLERDGETWVVSGGREKFRLKDSKGLRLLARLADASGQEIHALDLSAEGGTPARELGDAGPLLDAKAKVEYGRRLADLREALAEAESFHDTARAEAMQAELESLQQQLAAAVGLGGRDRKAAAASERARVNVQRRLRDAIKRVAAQDAELGRHLEWAVRTGTFCCYDPR